jgi:hypothetical protein
MYLEGPNCFSRNEPYSWMGAGGGWTVGEKKSQPVLWLNTSLLHWIKSQITWKYFMPDWRSQRVCAINLQWHAVSCSDSCIALGTANCWRLQRRHIFLVRWTLLSESDLSRLRRHLTASTADFWNHVFVSQCGFSQFTHALGSLAQWNTLF